MINKSNSDEILILASVLEARTRDDLVSRIKKVILASGFETFMIGLERQTQDGQTIHHVTSDYAIEWQSKYQEKKYAFNDPTIPYCQQSTSPLIWNDHFFKSAGAIHILEEARSYGVSHGLSIATHDQHGFKSMMSLVRDKPLERDAKETEQLLASARVISACVHHTGFNLLGVKDEPNVNVTLTGRETEVLKWVASGKTTWEISIILNLSEATVAFHVKNIMRKLNVHNRQQAIVIALRRRLIN